MVDRQAGPRGAAQFQNQSSLELPWFFCVLFAL